MYWESAMLKFLIRGPFQLCTNGWQMWLSMVIISYISKMTNIVYSFIFICGVSCAIFSSLLYEYLYGYQEPVNQVRLGAFLPHDAEIHISSDILRLDPNPGTQLAPTDLQGTKKGPEAEHEAVNTLQAAVHMHTLGRFEKARKLFEHALALSPRHPDILTEYGEFLEQDNDITRANQLYTRALRYSPGHSRALQNRLRTQPVVEQSDLELLMRIERKRDELSKIPQSSAALRRVKKEAYFQQIHHTVGIEGNTMTLSETRHVVETRMAVGGRSVMEHNEVLGLDEAIRFINNSLVHRIGDITLQDVLDIHRRVMGHVDPQEAGQLRTTQVYVSEHVPPAPPRLPSLLQGFVEWLNAPETLALHPIKYAALAHYKLVFIHPFADGNGRTSRLLMNLILMQAGYPPVIIRKQDRHVYYRALRLANEGDVRPFIRFIAHCAEKTLDVYVWATSEYVQKIAMSETEREEAAARDADEYAFIRNFNGDDDMVGFGASKVIDIGDVEANKDSGRNNERCDVETPDKCRDSSESCTGEKWLSDDDGVRKSWRESVAVDAHIVEREGGSVALNAMLNEREEDSQVIYMPPNTVPLSKQQDTPDEGYVSSEETKPTNENTVNGDNIPIERTHGR